MGCMRSRLGVALVASGLAILVNTALLSLADVIVLPTAHGGLLRLIGSVVGGRLSDLGLPDIWRQIGGPPVGSSAFQMGFHLAVGVAMGIFYAYLVEPLDKDRPLLVALIYAGLVWIVNAVAVLPLIGEGFAGSRHLSFAGMAWFAAAHTLYFVALAFIYTALWRGRPVRAA